MISCEKAAIICNKSQYGEATFLEKIKLKLHLLLCKVCAGFSKKNKKLTTLCEKADLRSLTEADKEKIRQHLNKQL